MAVRLTKRDKEKLNRINQSVRRKNKQMDAYDLPLYMPVLTASKVTSRKQLNDYLQEARTYTRSYGYKYKKNKYDVVASLSEIAEAKRLAQAVTRERAKRFKKIAPEEFTSRGKGIGSSIMQRKLMGDDRYSIYDPVNFNFSSLRNREQLERRIERFEKQLSPDYIEYKDKQLKDNIINAMRENWGNKGKKAIDYIKSLSPEEVTRQDMSEDVFDFNFIYDKEAVDRQVEIFEATYNIT